MKNLFLVLLISCTFSSHASTPLVTPTWLSNHLEDDNLFLLDIRSKDYFNYVHIPSSVQSDYGQWRQPQSKVLRKMLPEKVKLEQLLSSLGIKNNSNIIIISSGEASTNLAAASRVYWTLEQIGHKQKSILNGGLIEWAKNRLPLTQAKAAPPTKSNYLINNIIDQVDSKKIVKAINDWQIIDTRSVAEFKGLIASSDERKGTIKNSKSLPYDWFTSNKSGKFRSLDNIKSIASSIDYDNSKDSVLYCHTGHRAALSWFVLHELLGNKKAKLYDGSTRDWATQPSLPMTKKIHVKS